METPVPKSGVGACVNGGGLLVLQGGAVKCWMMTGGVLRAVQSRRDHGVMSLNNSPVEKADTGCGHKPADVQMHAVIEWLSMCLVSGNAACMHICIWTTV